MSENSREYARWNEIYVDSKYFYGADPGPVARRAVRYHHRDGGSGSALDVGCGEGQDLAFLAACGYQSLGLELTPNGVEKTRRLLNERGLSGQAQVQQTDLKDYGWNRKFDLVLAVNCLQFTGESAPSLLDCVLGSVNVGGVLGLSVFAPLSEEGTLKRSAVEDGIWFWTRREILSRLLGDEWQPLEVADLWQWNQLGQAPQAFVTLVARRLR